MSTSTPRTHHGDSQPQASLDDRPKSHTQGQPIVSKSRTRTPVSSVGNSVSSFEDFTMELDVGGALASQLTEDDIAS